MIFTPDERRALILLSTLFLLGLFAHLAGLGSPTPSGEADSLLVVLADEATRPPTEPPPGLLEEGKLRVNEANGRALEALPGVGPVLAGRILEARAADGPFRSWRDLIRVRGIGEKTARRLDRFLSFREPTLETAAQAPDSVQSARSVWAEPK